MDWSEAYNNAHAWMSVKKSYFQFPSIIALASVNQIDKFVRLITCQIYRFIG